MPTAPVLVAGRWRPATQTSQFFAANPSTGQELPAGYPISDWLDCQVALEAAAEAALMLERVEPSQIAGFLDRYAERLGHAAEPIASLAAQETGLPLRPRLLEVEMPRTINQLQQAAAAARSESWRNPVIDEAAGICSCDGPLGPVLLFGPNNFPLAFNSVAGGDFAAAIAAGNPVIAKAHSSHPGTSQLLAEQAFQAVSESGLPEATVQLLFGLDREDGLRMVGDARLAAISFTGSRRGGMALKNAADAAGKPVYLEMSSVNPVFFTPRAIRDRGQELAAELVGSCLLGAGQFCTCPNLFVVVEGPNVERFLDATRHLMESRPIAPLLAKSSLATLQDSIHRLVASGAEIVCGGQAVPRPGFYFQNTLLRTNGERFLKNAEALQTEAFGPATLVVVARDENQVLALAGKIEGSLTGSVYSACDGDDEFALQLMRVLRRKVGRLLNDKMPTGVAVSPAMNHGGPFPATGHPGFTAVGIPASIRRFTKRDCYDNVRPDRLPTCLRPRP